MIEHRVARPRGGRRPPCASAIWGLEGTSHGRGPGRVSLLQGSRHARALSTLRAATWSARSDLGEALAPYARLGPGRPTRIRRFMPTERRCCQTGRRCRTARRAMRTGQGGGAIGRGQPIRRALPSEEGQARGPRSDRDRRADHECGAVPSLRAERVEGLACRRDRWCDATKVEARGPVPSAP